MRVQLALPPIRLRVHRFLTLLALGVTLLGPAPTLAAEVATRLAEGVYVLEGANAAPSAGNLGRVGNLGFLVGTDGVVAIDSGSSRARGEELLMAIRAQTSKPVVALLISHPAQEFLFGSAAFVDRGIPVYAQAATPRLMAQRCEHCLATLQADLGAQRMAGTRLIAPQPLPFEPGAVRLGGRALHVLEGPPGTVPGNLLIRDDASQIVFAGALLSVDRVPAVQDTRPLAWRSALSALEDPSIRAVVPAYGPPVWRVPAGDQRPLLPAIRALQDYMRDLEHRVQDLYNAAVPLGALKGDADLPRYSDWNGYAANHLHNVFYRYLQKEAEDLASQ